MGVSENEIGLREGRAKFGDLVNRAEYAGEITYVTRHGRRVAAIVPIDLIPQEQAMAITVTDLAAELHVTRDDVLALVDQLVTLDSSETVVASETRHEVTLTGEAAATIREQLKGSGTYTLISATSGDSMPEGAVELAESGLDWTDLPDDAQAWATEQGYGDNDDDLLYVMRGDVELTGWPTHTVTVEK